MLWQKEKYPRNPLENLKRFNQENNAITRESIRNLSPRNYWRKKIWKDYHLWASSTCRCLAQLYRNYDSKEEILESIFQSSIAKITKSLDGYNLKTDLYQVWVYLFKEVKKEAKIISLAIDYNFERLLTKAVYDFLEKEMATPQMVLAATSILSGAPPLSLWISKWIKDGMKIPAEKIATLGLPSSHKKKK